jgi:hypothetical protein
MPDISMCKNVNCPLKENCVRFLADPNPHWQAYGDFQPNEEGRCDYYYPVNPNFKIEEDL